MTKKRELARRIEQLELRLGGRKRAQKRIKNEAAKNVVALKPIEGGRQVTKITEEHLGLSGVRDRKQLQERLTAMFMAARPPPGVVPKGKATLAMDEQLRQAATWAAGAFDATTFVTGFGGHGTFGEYGAFAEGMEFIGYPYLAGLAQRPEYRVISETIATEMTRKWIKVQASGGEHGAKGDKVKALTDELKRLKVQEAFQRVAEQDGFFGRAHLYLDFDEAYVRDPDENKTPVGDGQDAATQFKVKIGSFKRLQVVEAVWAYPTNYNSTNPLAPNWYKPDVWFAMGKEVHSSRFLTFIGREVTDMLKPAYSFGGLSMSQMAKPYVDNWLRTRQSVSDLLHSFTTFLLKTDMAARLSKGADQLDRRAALFKNYRDNKGLMVVDKDAEDFTNVSAPLGTLDHLQAQSQEHMAAVSRIPLVKLTGISPSGLNASSEGEIRTFYDFIKSYQERFFKENLDKVFRFAQVNLWGAVDPELSYDFEPLWSLDEAQEATVRKTDADTDAVLIDAGVLDPVEVRERVARDPNTLYPALDLTKIPAPPMDEQMSMLDQLGLGPPGGPPGQPPQRQLPPPGRGEAGADTVVPFGGDSWSEAEHPRGQPENAGEFAESPGGGSSKKKKASAKKKPAKAAELTKSERAWVKAYTADAYARINEQLRTGKLTPDVEEAVRHLDSAMRKSSLGQAETLYRGLDAEAARRALAAAKAKGPLPTLTFRGYTSTSREFDAAKEHVVGQPGAVLLQIDAAAGQSAVDVESDDSLLTDDPDYAGEQEVVLPRGLRVRLVEVVDLEGETPDAGGRPTKLTIVRGVVEPPEAARALRVGDLKKVGPQMGSNPGGVFADADGNKFYVKRGHSAAHVANETAAARLYALAGAPTLGYRPVEGGLHVATEWQDLDKSRVKDFSPEEIKKARRDFAAHAWLANWDAVGLEGDNLGTAGGKVVELDLGGALAFRARGAPKGKAFGDKVDEWDAMRDAGRNPEAARVFGGMTEAELKASAGRVARIKNEDIRRAAGDDALADRLIRRKRDLAARAGLDVGLDEWVESDHPRGQPENAGEFAPKGGGATGGKKTKAAKPKAAGSPTAKLERHPEVVDLTGNIDEGIGAVTFLTPRGRLLGSPEAESHVALAAMAGTTTPDLIADGAARVYLMLGQGMQDAELGLEAGSRPTDQQIKTLLDIVKHNCREGRFVIETAETVMAGVGAAQVVDAPVTASAVRKAIDKQFPARRDMEERGEGERHYDAAAGAEELGALWPKGEGDAAAWKKYGDAMLDECRKISASMNVDPARVSVSLETKPSLLNGHLGVVAASTSDETGEVVMFARHCSPKTFAGVLAHELEHVKYKQYRIHVKTAPPDDPVRKEFDQLYDVEALRAEDGVSGYSHDWWEKAAGGHWTSSAVYETLAEMARKRLETGELPGGPRHQAIYAAALSFWHATKPKGYVE